MNAGLRAATTTRNATHRGAAEAAGLEWKTAVYQQIQSQKDGGPGLTVERRWEFAKVSRAGFYRLAPCPAGADPETELRDALQRVALDFPSYGWPRP